MKQMMIDLFTSKKFLVMLAAIIVAASSKLGLNINPDVVNQILAMAAAYILGQGIADHGKEAAQITATSTAILASGVKSPAAAAVKALS